MKDDPAVNGGVIRTPPSPPGRSLRDILQGLQRDTPGFLREVARECGPIAFLRLPHCSAYLLTGPDLIEEVLGSAPGRFRKHADTRQFATILGDGLITSEGELWRRHRRLLAPMFMPTQVARHRNVMSEVAVALAVRAGSGEVRDLHADMRGLTLEIVVRTLFGTEPDARLHAVGELLDAAFRAIAEVWHSLDRFNPESRPLPAREKLQEVVAELDGILMGLIEPRLRGDAGGPDLVSALLRGCPKEDREQAVREVRNEAMTMLVAGHETTTLALTYTLYLLATNPEIASKVRAELEAARDPVEAPFLEAVVLESLRLYPPVWTIGREVVVDGVVGGFTLRAGSEVWMPQWVVHRDPRWYPEPDAFRPERWVDGTTEGLPRFSFFPFGGGPRVCIGQHFAMLELKVILAELCRRLAHVAVPETRLALDHALTLRLAAPVHVRVDPVIRGNARRGG
jgi:cytochrome P450